MLYCSKWLEAQLLFWKCFCTRILQSEHWFFYIFFGDYPLLIFEEILALLWSVGCHPSPSYNVLNVSVFFKQFLPSRFYSNKKTNSSGKEDFRSIFGAELILVCVNADNLASVKMLKRKKKIQAAIFVWSHQNSSLCLYFQSPRGGLQAHGSERMHSALCWDSV